MKITGLMAIFFLIGVVSASSVAFDRAAVHELRVTGVLTEKRQDHRFNPEGEIVLAATAFSDILVSQSVSPARFVQDNATVTHLPGGNWLVVWCDNRLGSRKIFLQRFDSLGDRLGQNEMVAGSATGADYTDPRLAVDTSGRVYLFYRDQSNGMIFGSRYTSAMDIDLAPFLVNDTSLESFAGPFDMAVFPDGQMVVVWENKSVLGSSIEMRLYAPSGVPRFDPISVNLGGSAERWVPSVAVAPGSGFLVAWEDYRNLRADIYARLFTGAGNPVGGDFTLVPPPHNISPQYAPKVTCVSNKYVIGWIDLREGQEVYVQTYDPVLGQSSESQLISSGDPLAANWHLHLSTMPGSRVLALWSTFGADSHILGLKLDSDMVPFGLPLVRNQSTTGQRWAPASDPDESGGYALTWTDLALNNANINFMLFDSLDTRLLAEEVVVNDDQTGAVSGSPVITAATDWHSLVCYTDQKNDAGDVYLRAISNAGVPYANEQRVNQDSGPDLQSEPFVATSSTRSLVVWIDSRNVGGFSGQRVYGRFGTLLGEFTDDEFMISDTIASAIKASPRAVMNGDNQGLVAWIDRRDGHPQVWGRWLTPGGGLDGDEFMISQSASDSSATDLSLGVDQDDQFCAIWLDVGTTLPTVKGCWFDADMNESGSFDWTDPTSNRRIEELATDIDPDGNIVLLWTGLDGVDRRVFVTRLAPDGTVLVPSTEMATVADPGATEPAVSVDSRGFVSAAWVDRREGKRVIYYRIIDPTLAPLSADGPISAASPEFMISPSTAASLGRAWFAWADPRENGMNIYAANLVYDPTSVEDDDASTIPKTYRLKQNYPNPFNPSTVISFTLPEHSDVTLTVLNLLGQMVTTLADEVYTVGEHHVIWDGTDDSGNRVASGVYLYRLKAGDFTESRKMLLLK